MSIYAFRVLDTGAQSDQPVLLVHSIVLGVHPVVPFAGVIGKGECGRDGEVKPGCKPVDSNGTGITV